MYTQGLSNTCCTDQRGVLSQDLRLVLTWREGQSSEVEGFLVAGAGAQGSSGCLVAGSLLLQHTAGQGATAALLLKHFVGAPQLVQAQAWNLQGPLICTPASSNAEVFCQQLKSAV